MRYNLDEAGGYDDYDVEGDEIEEEGYEEGEEYEEEEAEVEDRKPTHEEMEYLELRQRLKESIRKKKTKESAAALSNCKEKQKNLPYDNYGSFFGPSQPIIAQRVIQESKSLLENQHLVSRMLNSSRSNSNVKRSLATNSQGAKRGGNGQVPRAISELKKKVEKLKVARDYSFLSDDADLPAPSNEPIPRSGPCPSSEAQPAKMPVMSRQPLRNSGRNGQIVREERRPVSSNVQMKSKVLPNKASAGKHNMAAMGSKKQLVANKHNLTAVDSKKKLGTRNGVVPGRPDGTKVFPSKTPVPTVEKKSSAPTVKKLPENAHRPPISNMPSADSRQQLELKKRSVEPPRDKVTLKRPAPSVKPQNKPPKQVSSHATSKFNRPKKRPLSEEEIALNEIRKMFNTNRFANVDDDDDLSDMEAGFDEIMKEERKSAKIARKEDEEQLRLIEEEERRERMRKMAKKRKLGH